MKLDVTDLRYVTSEEFRVLTAVEMGSKNHEIVPTSLITQISGLRGGGVNKLIGSLAKRNLVARVQNAKYDGYRMTYGGYDFLAMRALSKRDAMYSVGNQIGTGKESDVYLVADAEGKEMVLKLHRLGRISFRSIKSKRDYMGKRKSASWMYMSRLFRPEGVGLHEGLLHSLSVLHEHGFPVPKPIDQARHCIVMSFINSYPLRQITEVAAPGKLYSDLMDLIVRLARSGLIHGDFNEFNILIRRKTQEPILIDFPQMVSTSHPNAEWYFNRDVECIRTFFKRRFRYESSLYPRFRTTMSEGGEPGFQLDVMVEASGFAKKNQKELEEYMKEIGEAEMAPEDGQDQDQESDETTEEEETEESEDEQVVETSQNEAGPSSPKSLHSDLSPLDVPLNTEDNPSVEEVDPSQELVELTEELDLQDIRSTAKQHVQKMHERQKRKYHSKKSTQRAGRAHGSKAKQDVRYKMESSAGWD
ncbi:RIO1 family-domain-containing protein [Flagelloscypha sp. PMI_526]|nr:RIO1 family-domain-containing protein [Flagelloscypha sp. PMI_526]